MRRTTVLTAIKASIVNRFTPHNTGSSKSTRRSEFRVQPGAIGLNNDDLDNLSGCERR